MINYVIPNNPDGRILERASKSLKDGNLISFPTDTNWVIAASPYSKKGVDSLYKIKEAKIDKHFSLLCCSISQASNFANIHDPVYRKIKRCLPGPYTLIFEPTGELPRYIKSYKKTRQIGIRIPDSILCQNLLNYLSFPLLETSIGPGMLKNSIELEYEEISFKHHEVYSYQIEESIGHLLDSIIDPGELEFVGESSIIDFSKDPLYPTIIREGAGAIDNFL